MFVFEVTLQVSLLSNQRVAFSAQVAAGRLPNVVREIGAEI